MSSHLRATTKTFSASKPKLVRKKPLSRNVGAAAARAKATQAEEQLATELLQQIKDRGEALSLKINALLARVG